MDMQNQHFSFLGTGSKIRGTFHLMGTTHLSSKIEGEITMEDSAQLFIEREGRVEGKIRCHNIDIYGEFSGILEATGKATIHPPASLTGRVIAKDLIIYPGAQLNIDASTLS